MAMSDEEREFQEEIERIAKMSYAEFNESDLPHSSAESLGSHHETHLPSSDQVQDSPKERLTESTGQQTETKHPPHGETNNNKNNPAENRNKRTSGSWCPPPPVKKPLPALPAEHRSEIRTSHEHKSDSQETENIKNQQTENIKNQQTENIKNQQTENIKNQQTENNNHQQTENSNQPSENINKTEGKLQKEEGTLENIASLNKSPPPLPPRSWQPSIVGSEPVIINKKTILYFKILMLSEANNADSSMQAIYRTYAQFTELNKSLEKQYPHLIKETAFPKSKDFSKSDMFDQISVLSTYLKYIFQLLGVDNALLALFLNPAEKPIYKLVQDCGQQGQLKVSKKRSLSWGTKWVVFKYCRIYVYDKPEPYVEPETTILLTDETQITYDKSDPSTFVVKNHYWFKPANDKELKKWSVALSPWFVQSVPNSRRQSEVLSDPTSAQNGVSPTLSAANSPHLGTAFPKENLSLSPNSERRFAPPVPDKKVPPTPTPQTPAHHEFTEEDLRFHKTLVKLVVLPVVSLTIVVPSLLPKSFLLGTLFGILLTLGGIVGVFYFLIASTPLNTPVLHPFSLDFDPAEKRKETPIPPLNPRSQSPLSQSPEISSSPSSSGTSTSSSLTNLPNNNNNSNNSKKESLGPQLPPKGKNNENGATAEDAINRGPKWFNMLLAAAISEYFNSEGFTKSFTQRLNDRVKLINRPPFIGDISIEKLNFGGNVVIVDDAITMLPPAQEGELRATSTLRYTGSQPASVLLSVEVLMNWPKENFLKIPVSLNVFIEHLSGPFLFVLPPGPDPLLCLGFTAVPTTKFSLRSEVGHVTLLKNLPKVEQFVLSKLKAFLSRELLVPNGVSIHIPIKGERRLGFKLLRKVPNNPLLFGQTDLGAPTYPSPASPNNNSQIVTPSPSSSHEKEKEVSSSSGGNSDQKQ